MYVVHDDITDHVKLKNYNIGVVTDDMILMPNFIKISQLLQVWRFQCLNLSARNRCRMMMMMMMIKTTKWANSNTCPLSILVEAGIRVGHLPIHT